MGTKMFSSGVIYRLLYVNVFLYWVFLASTWRVWVGEREREKKRKRVMSKYHDVTRGGQKDAVFLVYLTISIR